MTKQKKKKLILLKILVVRDFSILILLKYMKLLVLYNILFIYIETLFTCLISQLLQHVDHCVLQLSLRLLHLLHLG